MLLWWVVVEASATSWASDRAYQYHTKVSWKQLLTLTVSHVSLIEWLLVHLSFWPRHRHYIIIKTSLQDSAASWSFTIPLVDHKFTVVCQLHIANSYDLMTVSSAAWFNLCFGALSIPCALPECRQWNTLILQWVSTQQGLHISRF